MTGWIALARLMHELAIWRRAWRMPLLWWRDDDARTTTWQLDRLLQVRADLPLTLAIVPDEDLAPIAGRLNKLEGVTIAQHGVDHRNRLPDGGPRSEYAADAPQETINAQVAAGRARLVAAGLKPWLFVPPWNEMSDRLETASRAAGYRAYSIGIYGAPREGLAHVGAQVDILRWKDKPRFRGRARVLNALRMRLEERRKAGQFEEPVGLLTHHLVHDEAAWAFLGWFLPFSRKHFAWRPVERLSPGAVDAARSPHDAAKGNVEPLRGRA